MKRARFLFLLLFLTIVAGVAYGEETSPTRGRLDLNGIWDFALDPNNEGEADAWFDANAVFPEALVEGSSPKTPGKIVTPGIWDAQGYGAPSDKVKHNFVGKGWYRREISVPSQWSRDDSVYLVFEGISRSAKVWIDGKRVGNDLVGCVGSHELDVTEFVKPGKKCQLVVMVDSSQNWEIDPLLGASSLNDYMEIKWGGLWGGVYLETRPKRRLDSIYLGTRLEFSKTNRVARAVCRAIASVFDENRSSAFSGALLLEIYDVRGNCVASQFKRVENLDLSQGAKDVELTTAIPNAKLWSPDSPYLYKVKVTLSPDGDKKDVLISSYGMREIKFEGTRILLNGKPFYLRGYGDDHIYPVEFAMSTNKEMYLERLRTIKAFGFNHCRHHSCIMPKEYYEACDEIGMFPNAEMLLGYPQQIPGEGDLWKRNVPEGADPTPALNTIKERWAQVVKEFRNHPSIFIWVGGNELSMLGWERWNNNALGPEMREIAKRLDPDRYFTDCDGDWLQEYKTRGGRKTQDFYSVLFNEWSNPVLNGDKFKTDAKFDKPFISHESGNFLTFSRPDQIELFENTNYKPFWMVDGAAKINELGLANETEAWAKASEQLYLLEHKHNVESARKNENLSGYHWWLVQDYWTTSNGILDLFFRPKSIAPDDVLSFNNDFVLLQDGLDFTYAAGDKAEATLSASNYATDSKTGTFRCSLVSTQKDGTLSEEVVSSFDASAPLGKVTNVGKFAFTCPPVERPTEMKVRIEFSAPNDFVRSNSWSILVFPQRIAPKTTKTIYADETAIRYFPREWKVQPLANLIEENPTELPSDVVYAVSWATPEIVSAVQRGAGLVHFGGSQFLGGLPMQFQQTWWKAGDSETQNNSGTYVYPGTIASDLCPGDYCGAAWASLLDGSQKFNLETSQPRPEMIVRALASLVRFRDSGVLFDFRVGKGTVVVSGLHHETYDAKASDSSQEESPRRESLVNRELLARVLDLAANGSQTDVQWDPKVIVPPVKLPKGVALGLQRITAFAESGMWNSYRDMNRSVPNWVCRQDKKGNELKWRTSVVPKTESSAVTFLFAGGLGYATTAKTDGFVLSMNGKDLVSFDVVETFDGTSRFVWTNADETAALQFVATNELPDNDKYGIFLLTVPASFVKPNAEQEIAVRSLGEGSRRWFGVNLYYDFSDIESVEPYATQPYVEPKPSEEKEPSDDKKQETITETQTENKQNVAPPNETATVPVEETSSEKRVESVPETRN